MLTPQKKEFVLDRIREITKKIRDLEIQVDNLGYYIEYYIADDDEFPSNDTK